MWSVYDTCILLSGVITVVIAVLPLNGIPMRTRMGAGLVGGALIVMSLILGNMRSFRYPAVVMIGPVIALCVLGAVIWDSRRGHGKQEAGRQFNETTSGADHGESMVSDAVGLPRDSSVERPAIANEATTEGSGRISAWAEVHDVSTPSERLTELAAEYPEFVRGIVNHPNCYPELVEWAHVNRLLEPGSER